MARNNFYLDAMNIATDSDSYESPLSRLAFCFRTIKTAHSIRRAPASPEDWSEDSIDSDAIAHALALTTFCSQTIRYGLRQFGRGLRRPLSGNGLSFAQLATAGVVVVVVAGTLSETDAPDDSQDAQVRGIEAVTTAEMPDPAQISRSALMLKALVEKAGLSESIEIIANDSSIDITGQLREQQMAIWTDQVVGEYQQRGGSAALLNLHIEKL